MSTSDAMAGSTMRSRSAAAAGRATVGAAYFVGGLALLLAVWWLAIYVASKNPALSQFTAFGPAPAFKAIPTCGRVA